MKVINLYTGPDGEAHFRDVEMPMDQPVPGMKVSRPTTVKPVVFREFEGPPPDKGRWHTAPVRQMLIMMEGSIELEIGDGSKRVIGPGQILLAEDTTGRGHITRPIGPCTSNITMPLE